MGISRRELIATATLQCVCCITRANAWAAPLDPALRRWVLRVGELGQAVRAGTLAPAAWQDGMAELHASLSPEELIRFIDMDRLVEGLQAPKDRIGAIAQVPWPDVDGFPVGFRFGHKLFVYRQGACTPPHVHNHLVSAHWVLEGRIRARTYDRVADLDASIRLRPTRDEALDPGGIVTMSDQRDNGHWFEGLTGRSISFDIPISGISPEKAYGHPAEGANQIFIDPTVAPSSDGTIDAPIIRFEQSLQKFARGAVA